MKRIFGFALALIASTASAADLWFDPPNPTSRTPVAAHIVVRTPCPAKTMTVTRTDRLISINVVQMQGCPPTAPPYFTTADLGVLHPALYDVVVSYDNLLVAAAEAKLPVQDAAAHIQVLPNVAPVAGDKVTIKGSGIAPMCIVPCPPVVMFGDIQAELLEQTGTDTIVVRAPAHEAGVVDVSVTAVAQTWRAPAAFEYFAADAPPDPAFVDIALRSARIGWTAARPRC